MVDAGNGRRARHDAGGEDDFDLRNQLEQLLTRGSVKSGKSRVLEEADEDVINLVAMLFEFMLDDSSVPDAFKALIARLQIPLLKVAVLDKSLLSDNEIAWINKVDDHTQGHTALIAWRPDEVRGEVLGKL